MEVFWKKHDCFFHRVFEYIYIMVKKWKNVEKNLQEMKISVLNKITFHAEKNDRNNVCSQVQTMTFTLLMKN